jgi:hypothetical protein
MCERGVRGGFEAWSVRVEDNDVQITSSRSRRAKTRRQRGPHRQIRRIQIDAMCRREAKQGVSSGPSVSRSSNLSSCSLVMMPFWISTFLSFQAV